MSLLAETLNTIHDGAVVHGNLNPQNVLIDPQRKILKLIGFGRAKYLSEADSQSPLPTGNIDYRRLNRVGAWIGRLTVGRISMRWGVVFFELLTGCKPFVSDDEISLIHRHMAQPVPDPREFSPDLPEGLAKIVCKMLAKD